MMKSLASCVLIAVAVLAIARPAPAGVMTFPGLSAIRFTEYSGGPISHIFLPNSVQMMNQLAFLNPANRDFAGVPVESYDVFYSNANGTFNVNGNYVTIEARFPGQQGGGLNIAAVDLLLGPAPFTVCRADVLASSVGLGANYIAGSEALAVDPDLPLPVTFTTMGNTAGSPSNRLRVTVGWKKIIPEPATVTLATGCLAAVALGRRRRREGVAA